MYREISQYELGQWIDRNLEPPEMEQDPFTNDWKGDDVYPFERDNFVVIYDEVVRNEAREIYDFLQSRPDIALTMLFDSDYMKLVNDCKEWL